MNKLHRDKIFFYKIKLHFPTIQDTKEHKLFFHITNKNQHYEYKIQLITQIKNSNSKSKNKQVESINYIQNGKLTSYFFLNYFSLKQLIIIKQQYISEIKTFLFNILAIFSYDIIYDTNLTGEVGCISNLYDPIWQDSLSQSITDCVYKSQCGFSLVQSQSSVAINLDLTQYSSNFSFIGVDILVNTDSNSINGSINTQSIQQLTNLKTTEYEDKCAQILLKKTSFFQLGNQQTLGSKIVVNIQKDSIASYLEIRRIRVYTNCVQNCLRCKNSNSCSQCLYGFTKIKLSNGNYVCEQTSVCSSISNCFSCITNSNNQAECLQCIPGYKLISGSNCASNNSNNIQCQANQYIDQNNQCQTYSSICKYESRYDSYLDCPNSATEIQNYKCPSNKQLLILMNQNNEIYNCVCKIQNCSSCQSLQTCEQCMDGYFLQNNKCIPCFDSNCSGCSSFSSCTICNDGYFLDSNSQFCYEQCPTGQKFDINYHTCVDCLENCIDCSPTQCFRCVNDLYYQVNPSKPQTCIRTIPNKFQILEKLTENGYEIKLTFTEKLDLLGKNANDILDFEFSRSINYLKEIKVVNQNQLWIYLNMTESCKDQYLQLIFTDQNFYESNFLNQNKTQIKLDYYIPISAEQKDQLDSTQKAGKSISTSTLSTFIPIAVLGNFYILINTIDLTSYLYYLLFINIRYPQNILSFFDFFKNFQFPFIPNFFTDLVTSGYTQQAPKKFMEMSNDAYFLNSAGQSITIVAFFIILYTVIKIISKLKIYKISPYLLGAIERTWEYGAFFDILCTVYIYVIMGVLLQFTVYDFSDETYIINYMLHNFWALIVIPIPFLMTLGLYTLKNLKSDQIMQQYLSSIIGGLNLYDENDLGIAQKDNLINQVHKVQNVKQNNQSDSVSINVEKGKNLKEQIQTLQSTMNILDKEQSNFKKRRRIHQYKLSKLCNGILYIRKLFFSLIIVFLTEHQYLQIVLICFINLLVVIYIFYICPYDRYSENIKNGCGEVFLIAIYIAASFLVEDGVDDDEQDRFNIGWIIIGLSAFILLWNTSILVYESLKSILLLIISPFRKTKTEVVPSAPLIMINHKYSSNELPYMRTEFKTEARRRTCSTFKVFPLLDDKLKADTISINSPNIINEIDSPNIFKDSTTIASPMPNQRDFLMLKINNMNQYRDKSNSISEQISPFTLNNGIQSFSLNPDSNDSKQINDSQKQQSDKSPYFINLEQNPLEYLTSERLRILDSQQQQFQPKSTKFQIKLKSNQRKRMTATFGKDSFSPMSISQKQI